MDPVLHAAGSALAVLFTPMRMGLLLVGVMLGLVAGVIPGLGGIAALSLLLPFTFGIDRYSAMAILMGLAAAISHADVIPAVLFGVPGTVGCAATVMDGYPMAKRGEAGRALGAAFSASLIGGVFGAIVLGIAIPIISPVVSLFGSPELLAICVFGMTLAASLSGTAPLKGMVAALLGVLFSMVGEDSQTSTLRFSFDMLYLWSGLPIVPVALGIFAIPELCDLMITRKSIATGTRIDAMSGQWQGWKDSLRSWFLVLRTAVLGAVCAMVPGLGAPVIDWIAYGHALKTEKRARETFGKGDVRGVIATESSTNAREGGSLVTTIAFGVPGQPSMAILLSAFLIQGITPGPEMLGKHLDVTYTVVWSLTLANVFGTAICFAFANQFARLATIRYSLLLPIVMVLVYLGALEGQHSWGDFVVLIAFGAIGWIMKRCGWPRPPLVLGFVLGKLIERYMFISVERYGWDWLTHGFVLLMFALSMAGLVQQVLAKRPRSAAGARRRHSIRRRLLSMRLVFAGLALLVFLLSLPLELQWAFEARLVPLTVSLLGVAFGAVLVLSEAFVSRSVSTQDAGPISGTANAPQPRFDAGHSYPDVPERAVDARALAYFGWIAGTALLAYLLGAVPGLVLSTLLFIGLQASERWSTALAASVGVLAFLWIVFDRLVHEAWPPSVIGNALPALRSVSPWF